jgi:glycosyltransferase involved in cell wall biosynthesis
MRVLYDLSILRHPQAGTARYAVELLRAMRPATAGDVLLETRGWRRGPRGQRRWRLLNAGSDIGWLTVGALWTTAVMRADVWYSPANVLPIALPRPCVVTIHDTNVLLKTGYDRAFAAYARALYTRSGRRAHAVIADSTHARMAVAEGLGIPDDRVVVAYPGLDHGRPASTVPSPVDGPFVLFVGQTEPHKNTVRLVDAWSRTALPDFRLVIAGPPGRDEERLRSAIANASGGTTILRLGRVDEDELAALYANATAFVFPSIAEGFGFPPLEAMRHGVPTAVADAQPLPEVTRGAALLFDPLDPDAIADALRRVVTDDSLRRELGPRGRDVASSYRWAHTADVVWRTIREAAA